MAPCPSYPPHQHCAFLEQTSRSFLTENNLHLLPWISLQNGGSISLMRRILFSHSSPHKVTQCFYWQSRKNPCFPQPGSSSSRPVSLAAVTSCQVSLYSRRPGAVASTSSPSLAQLDRKPGADCELTLEIPEGGQSHAEGVLQSGRHRDPMGREAAQRTSLWTLHHAAGSTSTHPGPKGSGRWLIQVTWMGAGTYMQTHTP